ncbi:MAG: hypothetical protein UY31_C0023G0007 [Candidatus Wolfebacteria bacterium GW2011_GWE1_48_7]|uniref:Uncharacterized protein n=1 Tax=Candidatus Wolfebacteria bacterium GW2011_GWB1_47_1 TaxID=1619007 RepID=A0A0G4AS62_9BACT|nr:MAG: hypothetical protein UX70_C0001G0866 [Candidatus Wolfebacteria bacterium GW2011_GWB1_47_1]KKU42151.1 MAG: hypothetical protein UX58_C0003G0075 [Candidatus Wolfebacteria bacterium GW2011_GWB2_46_69]KKU54073.1 MAG: hypothetical protein UX76_C0006G0039 [Candidatus Wolfebacteria bacterium GW2011_GWC1_47_103]KKU59260.1 MAG: hypothetical protein UX83_C0006G0030 [Candidatus Wolfebacteria bacterium GW2011_GWE2_47_12]KKU99599.1 MAG: hypothetical protein UY31_C0023G0007 [Candidatus Wolfebacteria 
MIYLGKAMGSAMLPNYKVRQASAELFTTLPGNPYDWRECGEDAILQVTCYVRHQMTYIFDIYRGNSYRLGRSKQLKGRQ